MPKHCQYCDVNISNMNNHIVTKGHIKKFAEIQRGEIESARIKHLVKSIDRDFVEDIVRKQCYLVRRYYDDDSKTFKEESVKFAIVERESCIAG